MVPQIQTYSKVTTSQRLDILCYNALYIVIYQEFPFNFDHDTVCFIYWYNFVNWFRKLASKVDFANGFNFDASLLMAFIIMVNVYALNYESQVILEDAEH